MYIIYTSCTSYDVVPRYDLSLGRARNGGTIYTPADPDQYLEFRLAIVDIRCHTSIYWRLNEKI